MGKKKILYYTDCPFFAGCENMIANFFKSEELSKGFDIVLVYRYSERYEEGAKRRMDMNRAIPVHLVSGVPKDSIEDTRNKPFFAVRKVIRNLSLWYRKYYSIRKNKKVLQAVFGRINPDILHINNGGYPAAISCYSAVLAAKKCGIDRVVYVVNNMAADYHHPLRWFDRRLDGITKRQVTYFVNGSNNAGKRLRDVLQISGSKQITLRNGIVPRKVTISREEFRKQYGIEDNTIVFAEVANLEERKGHRVLLKAIKRLVSECALEKFIVFLEGNGPLKEEIAAYILDNKLSDYVLMVEFDYIYNLYNAIDVLILPSLYNEDFPNTIIEAMGQGIPVIGTSIAGIPEQINDHITGRLIPPGDPDELANAMIELAKDNAFYRFCSANAKQVFEKNYTAKISVNNYIKLYNSLLENNYNETYMNSFRQRE